MDRTFRVDKSVLLGPFLTKYPKQNANQLFGKSARFAFTGLTLKNLMYIFQISIVLLSVAIVLLCD